MVPPPVKPKPKKTATTAVKVELQTASTPSKGTEKSQPPPPTVPKPRRLSSQRSEKPPPPQTAPKPQKAPKQQSSLQLLEQLQDPLSLEYITLREMLADLVDLLAGNAPVITQLNNHLFSSGLIAKVVHIEVQNAFLSPFERANKNFNAVLATLQCHPSPTSVFTSLITALHKVGLTSIATKLMDCFNSK